MSDYCWLQLRILRSDLMVMEELIGEFDDVVHEDERSVIGIVEQAPGAYQDQLKELARRSATFEGYHEACIGAWDAHAFVGVSGAYTEILCAPMSDAAPVVIAEEDGSISPDSLAKARSFFAALQNARAALEGPPSAGSGTYGVAP